MSDTFPTKKAKVTPQKKPTFRLSSGPIEIVYGDKQKSEETYRTIFENTGTAMVIIEDDDTISLANVEFEKMSGYTKKQVENKKKWMEFFAEEDLEFMEKYHKLRRIFPDVAPRNYEARFKSRNGKIKHVYLTVAIIPGTNKTVGSVMDITKQKEAERILEKRIREFNMLYRIHSHIRMALGFGVVLNNVAKDIAQVFSDKVCVEIVFDKKRYRTKKCKDLIHKFEEPVMVHGIQRGLIRVGYPEPVSISDKSPFTSEERKLVETAAQILARHAVGREAVERYRKVVKKAVTGIYIVEKGIIRYANARFYKIFKCTKNNVLGRQIDDFILGCPFYKEVAVDPKISSLRSITKGRLKNGQEIDLDVVYQKIDYHGKPAVLGHVHDITNIKRAEKRMKHFNEELKQLVDEKTHRLEIANKRLQSLNELKDEFIAVASHELRSPLTSIRGYLSFLVEQETLDQMPDSAKQYLLRTYNNAESLNHLVNNILDVSRLDTGRFELQTINTDVVQLAQNIIDSLSFQAGERNITINFKNPSCLDKLMLEIDPIRISQVLRNLLDNAIKYSRRDKQITVEVTTDWGFAIIKISDQGIGIPKAKMKYIFDKFSQFKDTGTKYKGGAGLGLFIAKRIIQLHGGIIKVESEKNKGTVFTIQLPLIANQ